MAEENAAMPPCGEQLSSSSSLRDWEILGIINREANRLYESAFDLIRGERPCELPIDIVEHDAKFELTAELPGMAADDIEVAISHRLLTITGEKKMRAGAERGVVSERRYGAFKRSVPLQDSVDTGRIEAVFANGILTVILPKTEEARQPPRRIPVRAQ